MVPRSSVGTVGVNRTTPAGAGRERPGWTRWGVQSPPRLRAERSVLLVLPSLLYRRGLLNQHSAKERGSGGEGRNKNGAASVSVPPAACLPAAPSSGFGKVPDLGSHALRVRHE